MDVRSPDIYDVLDELCLLGIAGMPAGSEKDWALKLWHQPKGKELPNEWVEGVRRLHQIYVRNQSADELMKRVCTGCHMPRNPLTDFGTRKSRTPGKLILKSQCYPCQASYMRYYNRHGGYADGR